MCQPVPHTRTGAMNKSIVTIMETGDSELGIPNQTSTQLSCKLHNVVGHNNCMRTLARKLKVRSGSKSTSKHSIDEDWKQENESTVGNASADPDIGLSLSSCWGCHKKLDSGIDSLYLPETRPLNSEVQRKHVSSFIHVFNRKKKTTEGNLSCTPCIHVPLSTPSNSSLNSAQSSNCVRIFCYSDPDLNHHEICDRELSKKQSESHLSPVPSSTMRRVTSFQDRLKKKSLFYTDSLRSAVPFGRGEKEKKSSDKNISNDNSNDDILGEMASRTSNLLGSYSVASFDQEKPDGLTALEVATELCRSNPMTLPRHDTPLKANRGFSWPLPPARLRGGSRRSSDDTTGNPKNNLPIAFGICSTGGSAVGLSEIRAAEVEERKFKNREKEEREKGSGNTNPSDTLVFGKWINQEEVRLTEKTQLMTALTRVELKPIVCDDSDYSSINE